MIIEPRLTGPNSITTDIRAHVASFLDKDSHRVFNGLSSDFREAAQRDLANTFYGPIFDQIREFHGGMPANLHDVDVTASLNNHEKIPKVKEIFEKVWEVTHNKSPITFSVYQVETQHRKTDTLKVWGRILDIINGDPLCEEIQLTYDTMEELYDADPKGALGTWIDHLPETARNMTSLSLAELRLWSVPPEISKFTQLKTLSLSHNELRDLPSTIGDLIHLQSLDLSINRIRELPDSIGNLRELKKLLVWFNHLTKLPDSIGNLHQLERLQLTSNNLTELPDTIGNLHQLRRLELGRGNQLSELPRAIGDLYQLEVLELDLNRLTELPFEIGNLDQLEKLTLNDNLLFELPPEVGQLVRLKILSLCCNQLTELPETIENLDQLDLRSRADVADLTDDVVK